MAAIKIYKMKNLRKAIIPMAVIMILHSCSPLTSHQTGRTLGKQSSSTTISLDISGETHPWAEKLTFPGPKSDTNLTTINLLPAVELKKGVRENLDLGFYVNLSGYTSFSSKFQTIGNLESKFASSVGLDLGFHLTSLITEHPFTSAQLSMYNSYHFRDNAAFTFSPRFSWLVSSSADILSKANSTSDFTFGFSTGFIFGTYDQFSFQLSNHWVAGRSRPSFLISMAYILGFNRNPVNPADRF